MASQLLQWAYTLDEAASLTWTIKAGNIVVSDEITGNAFMYEVEAGADFVRMTMTKTGAAIEWPRDTPLSFTGRDNIELIATIYTADQMALHFMQCTSERDRVDKTAYLTEIFRQSGRLREDCEVTAPVILFEYDGAYIPAFNYVYIPRFNRYYYLEKLDILQTGLYEMCLKCDVLNTYKDAIRAQSGTVARNQHDYNPDITDTQRPLEAKPVIDKRNLDDKGRDIVTAGGTSITSDHCYVITVVTNTGDD